MVTVKLHQLLPDITGAIYQPATPSMFPSIAYDMFNTIYSRVTLGAFTYLGDGYIQPTPYVINSADNYIFDTNEIKDLGWAAIGIDMTTFDDTDYPIGRFYIKKEAGGTFSFGLGSLLSLIHI